MSADVSEDYIYAEICYLFYAGVSFRLWIPPKCRLTFNGLHGVISQRVALFSSDVPHVRV
jgi:hypothetical protein